MARTLELQYLSGVSPTVELVTPGTNAIAETITLTEKSVAKTVYTGTITAAAGDYQLALKIGSSYVMTDFIRIESADGTYWPAGQSQLNSLWRRFFKKATMPKSGNGSLVTYEDNGSTARTTQTVTDDGSTQTLGSS